MNQMFSIMASSGALSELRTCMGEVEKVERDKASKLAIDALYDDAHVAAAQRQLGRALMMKDFVSFLETFIKK